MTSLLERARFLLTDLPFSGMSPEEWHQACAHHAREQVDFYRSLSPAQGKELALAALHLFEQGKNTRDYLVEEILTKLANSVPGSLQGLHAQLLDRNIHWGDQGLYREADAATRDRIISLLEADNIPEILQSDLPDVALRQYLLPALAWIGDEYVQKQFLKWRETPLPWSISPYFRQPLDAYAHYAGWELTGDGKRRDLYFWQCYELIPIERAPAEDIPGPVTVIASHEEVCDWCGRQLLTLFDFDVTDPRFDFLPVRGDRLRIAMCSSCCIFSDAHAFFDVDMHGASHWSSYNGEHNPHQAEENIPLSPGRLVLGRRRRTPFETSASYWQQGISQIGGHPEWVHSPEYPCCPGCQQTMMFVGQLEPLDILADTEGIIYAFLCAECGKTTTRFQYT